MASNVVVKWYGQQIMREIQREMRARARRAARTIANQLVDNIDTRGPPASVPGEFPHTVSGALLESVNIFYEGDSATVHVDAPHAKFVEELRPFFERTIDECSDKVERIMTAPMG